MWLREIGLMWSLGRQELASLLSITNLEMRNLAEICSNCRGAEKLLMLQIDQNLFFSVLHAVGAWGESGAGVTPSSPAALAPWRSMTFARTLCSLKENWGISKVFHWKKHNDTKYPRGLLPYQGDPSS